jgi:hypothetical protein
VKVKCTGNEQPPLRPVNGFERQLTATSPRGILHFHFHALSRS